MSYVAKLAFATSVAVSVGIIGYVHYKQYDDRERLHSGVLRDVEQRQRRKTENIYLLQQQIELTKKTSKMEIEESQLNNSEDESNNDLLTAEV